LAATIPGNFTRTDDPRSVIAIPDPDSIRGNANSSFESRNLLSRMRIEDVTR
jgi:hypothetical protein